MAKSELNFDPDVVKKQLEAFKSKMITTITRYCEAEARNLEAYMKYNKPWTNRTGQATQRLTGISKQTSPTEWTITLSHGVSYGIFLELCHEGKYAIIQPTITAKSGDVMRGFNHIIDRAKKGM